MERYKDPNIILPGCFYSLHLLAYIGKEKKLFYEAACTILDTLSEHFSSSKYKIQFQKYKSREYVGFNKYILMMHRDIMQFAGSEAEINSLFQPVESGCAGPCDSGSQGIEIYKNVKIIGPGCWYLLHLTSELGVKFKCQGMIEAAFLLLQAYHDSFICSFCKEHIQDFCSKNEIKCDESIADILYVLHNHANSNQNLQKNNESREDVTDFFVNIGEHCDCSLKENDGVRIESLSDRVKIFKFY